MYRTQVVAMATLHFGEAIVKGRSRRFHGAQRGELLLKQVEVFGEIFFIVFLLILSANLCEVRPLQQLCFPLFGSTYVNAASENTRLEAFRSALFLVLR